MQIAIIIIRCKFLNRANDDWLVYNVVNGRTVNDQTRFLNICKFTIVHEWLIVRTTI